jgi:ribonuclease P protein component
MPASDRDETFPPRARIRSKRTFDAIFAARCSAGDRRMTIHAQPGEAGIARLGLAVGRRYGGAVQRNRIKRLLREAFRRIRHDLPPLDIVVLPRPGREPTVPELQESLRRLAAELAARLADRMPPAGKENA